jgi:hypothetical protein
MIGRHLTSCSKINALRAFSKNLIDRRNETEKRREGQLVP